MIPGSKSERFAIVSQAISKFIENNIVLLAVIVLAVVAVLLLVHYSKKPRDDERRRLRFWLQAAAIGGVYAALTMVLAPISYGPLQVRVSESMTVLPYFTPAAVPGLFIGCLISNAIMSPYPLDFIIGSSATLGAALLSYALRKIPWLVPLPPVIVNGAAIGAMLYYLYGVPPSLWADMGFVAIGEAIACYAIGLPLLKYMTKHRRIFEY